MKESTDNPKESTTMAPTDTLIQESAEVEQPKPKQGASVTWTIEGAPPAGKTQYHLARLALQCTGGIVEGQKHISVVQLRTMLADAGITDPEHTTWSFTLPNGKTIGAIAQGEPVPEPKARPVVARPASKGKAADRIVTLNAKKAAAKAARDAGHPIPDSTLAAMDAATAVKVEQARLTRRAPAAKAS